MQASTSSTHYIILIGRWCHSHFREKERREDKVTCANNGAKLKSGLLEKKAHKLPANAFFKYSMSLTIREMQGKDRKMLPPTCQDGNYLKKQKTNVGKNVKTSKHLHNGNEKWQGHYGTEQRFFKTLPYDTATPFLDLYSKGLKSGFHQDISNSMFTAELFTVAKM